jgi:hypothetical protein
MCAGLPSLTRIRAFVNAGGWHRLPDSARQTGYFLCVAKESNQRKATPATVAPWRGLPDGARP